MSLTFVIDDDCPKCRKPIRFAVVDLHPTRTDAAIHTLTCAYCGHAKTTVLPLRRTGIIEASPSLEMVNSAQTCPGRH